MKVWRDYRVTIPVEIRRKLGLYPGTEVDFIDLGNDTFEIVKLSPGSGRSRTKRASKTPLRNSRRG
ncbi:MAG: AbrB/MazE/SpoVT family DNA-binding domain-containing protein [Pyrinomonadaceae bacterium]